MSVSDLANKIHSGIVLQKIREYQGLELLELAYDLSIPVLKLDLWEKEGIPDNEIINISHYFEVPVSIFKLNIKRKEDLGNLVYNNLFPKNCFDIQEKINSNRMSRSPALDLSCLGLNEIPKEIFDFHWLTSINLSDNNIGDISCSIIKLTSLKTLNLSNNLLIKTPNIICSLPTLDDFVFINNPFTVEYDLLSFNDLKVYFNKNISKNSNLRLRLSRCKFI